MCREFKMEAKWMPNPLEQIEKVINNIKTIMKAKEDDIDHHELSSQ